MFELINNGINLITSSEDAYRQIQSIFNKKSKGERSKEYARVLALDFSNNPVWFIDPSGADKLKMQLTETQ